MTQVFDDGQPDRAGDRRQGRAVRGHPGPHAGQGRLLRRPARLRAGRPAQGQQAARPGTSRKAGVTPRRHLVELRTDDAARLQARPGGLARHVRGRPVVDVDRHEQGQGHRRCHEAARLQGSGRLPRHAAQAPLARLDRWLRHPGPRLQGPAHGRPDGQRPHHRAEPQRPRRGRREGPAPDQGCDPGPNGGLVLVRTAAKKGARRSEPSIDVLDAERRARPAPSSCPTTSSTCRSTSR